MRDILCTSPECQTTAGCQCSRVGRITQLTYGKRTPVGAGDGNTYIVDVAHYEHEIRRLQAELAAARQKLAEAKIAIGWARDAGLEEAAKAVEAALIDQSSRGRWIASRHAEVIRGLPSTKEIAAASLPTIADPVKEGGR